MTSTPGRESSGAGMSVRCSAAAGVLLWLTGAASGSADCSPARDAAASTVGNTSSGATGTGALCAAGAALVLRGARRGAAAGRAPGLAVVLDAVFVWAALPLALVRVEAARGFEVVVLANVDPSALLWA